MNSSQVGGRVYAPLEKATQSITEPFLDFVSAQSASGWVLLSATILAICFANSSWGGMYFDLLHLELGISLGGAQFKMTLQHWVNDGLMTLFFFLLGLELKRELLVGELSNIKNASSVLCAAIGGMLLPAGVFLMLANTSDIRAGWAIPIATDTAFALMILVLLGDRVPAAARAFLVGLAIVDDLGAILVIAIAYTDDFLVQWLVPVVVAVTSLLSLNLLGIRNGYVYLIVGVVLWFLLTRLGFHGTLAGVIVALLAPVRPAIDRPIFAATLKMSVGRFEKVHNRSTESILEQPKQNAIAHEVIDVATRATTPLSRWEHRLEAPISFVVMPLFAFMNAGILLSFEALETAWGSSLSGAIFFGLLFGKPIGILVGVWFGRILGWVELPGELSMPDIFGIGLLGGIGFTMSLFIATLSFEPTSPLLEIARQSVILSSLCTGVFGYFWLRWAGKKRLSK
ncbi:MAG: NhaA family Na+:H+ antiporter [Candidatus Azotimanducaceae bacterium]|jgi:NhaA family Na+:H+ antiporter